MPLREANHLELKHFSELRAQFLARAERMEIHKYPQRKSQLDREFTAALDRYGYFPKRNCLLVRIDLDELRDFPDELVAAGHIAMLAAIDLFKRGPTSAHR